MKTKEYLPKLIQERPYYRLYLSRGLRRRIFFSGKYEWLSLWDYKSNLMED